MRYEMRENSQGWDICDTEAAASKGEYFMNIDECVERLNEQEAVKNIVEEQMKRKADILRNNNCAITEFSTVVSKRNKQIEELKAENKRLRSMIGNMKIVKVVYEFRDDVILRMDNIHDFVKSMDEIGCDCEIFYEDGLGVSVTVDKHCTNEVERVYRDFLANMDKEARG